MIKKGARAKYCSKECYGKSKTIKALERNPAIQCKQCGKKFRSKDLGAIYCSRDCYYASTKGGPDKECAMCGASMPWNSPYECCSVQCAALLKRLSNKEKQANCLNCGEFILMKPSAHKFCSTRCAYEYRKSPELEGQSCKQCGVAIHSHKPRVFCGSDCQSQYIKESNFLDSIRPTAKEKVLRDCAYCGEPFYRANKNTRFCSSSCAVKKRSEESKIERTDSCELCGAEYVRRTNTQRFCGRSCASKAQIKAKAKPKPKLSVVQRGGMTEREYDVYLLLEGLSPGGFYHNLRLAPMGAVKGKIYYLLDFADPVRKLNIEVDGPEHFVEDKLEADKVRDEWLTSQGWTILRVTNEEVLSSIDSVKEKIRSLVMT